MKVSFHISYHVCGQQKMYLTGSIAALGHGNPALAKEMTSADGQHWTLQIDLPSPITEVNYQYVLIDNEGNITAEPWKRMHRATFNMAEENYILYDYWREKPENIALYTSAFTKNLFAHNPSGQPKKTFERNLIIRVPNPRVEKSQRIAITGNQPCVGNWETANAKILEPSAFPEWEVCLNTDEITFPFEYKFFVCDESKRVCHWEQGDNRLLTSPPAHENQVAIISEYPYRDISPQWKGAGTVIPVFSLRSEQSFGVGDLHDLRLLIDWAKETHQCVIQVLPMNDTTCTHTRKDSYPYSAISIFALHPMYISLARMGRLNDPARMKYFRQKQNVLNKKEEVDYENVQKYKTAYCRTYFEQEKETILNSADFKSFHEANRFWLHPYAAFCYYRDKYRTADFTKWEKDAIYEPDKTEKLCAETSRAYSEIAYTFFLQFVLHTQFKEVSNYARQKGVILKGDLPIGIHRMSVEAWTEASYFNMNAQAGAPPDDFSAIGQNWSFPTYNWEVMEKDGFAWWKKRFAKLNDYFDCFRIDHILGFFRIWEIPLDYVEGLCGHFRPAMPLTVDEIKSYGIVLKDEYVGPSIHRRHLTDLFGKRTKEVTERFLSPVDSEHMILKPFCNTQRKIEDYFGNEHKVSADIKSGLFAIANEVLFLEDPYEEGKYHPRIIGSQSYKYQDLTKEEQAGFDKLHNDFFYERHRNFWKANALQLLRPLVETTDMLVCGEDLGMVPDTVHEVMEELDILSLELERISKTFGVDFTELQKIPYLSVCTTSTHDMNPLRAWWKENPELTQKYYETILRLKDKAPETCSADIAEHIVRHHLHANSMLTIIPLQDWLAISNTLKHSDIIRERINIPADPNHYWRYRMHVSLEKLLQADEFNKKMGAMLLDSHRTNMIT